MWSVEWKLELLARSAVSSWLGDLFSLWVQKTVWKCAFFLKELVYHSRGMIPPPLPPLCYWCYICGSFSKSLSRNHTRRVTVWVLWFPPPVSKSNYPSLSRHICVRSRSLIWAGLGVAVCLVSVLVGPHSKVIQWQWEGERTSNGGKRPFKPRWKQDGC